MIAFLGGARQTARPPPLRKNGHDTGGCHGCGRSGHTTALGGKTVGRTSGRYEAGKSGTELATVQTGLSTHACQAGTDVLQLPQGNTGVRGLSTDAYAFSFLPNSYRLLRSGSVTTLARQPTVHSSVRLKCGPAILQFLEYHLQILVQCAGTQALHSATRNIGGAGRKQRRGPRQREPRSHAIPYCCTAEPTASSLRVPRVRKEDVQACMSRPNIPVTKLLYSNSLSICYRTCSKLLRQ